MLKLETHSPERLRRFPLLCAIAKKVDTAAAKRPLRGSRWSGPSRYLAALGLFWLAGLHAQTTEALQPNAPALYQPVEPDTTVVEVPSELVTVSETS